jgi:hypothetical protein
MLVKKIKAFLSFYFFPHYSIIPNIFPEDFGAPGRTFQR